MKHERPAAQARQEFEELNALRLAIEERLDVAVPSLLRYADDGSGGFFHQLTDPDAPGRIEGKENVPGDPSRASTATCTAFLVASGRWASKHNAIPWSGRAASLSQTLADGCWESAGLPQGNPFTVSFLLEALHDLDRAAAQEANAGLRTESDMGPDADPASACPPGRDIDAGGAAVPEISPTEEPEAPADPQGRPPSLPTVKCGDEPREGPAAGSPVREQVEFWTRHLRDELVGEPVPGGLKILEFPETAFLAYKAVRVLKLWDRLDGPARKAASRFAWDRLYQESVGVAAGTPDADVFELAYAALTVTATTSQVHMTPRQRDALRHGIEQFFGLF